MTTIRIAQLSEAETVWRITQAAFAPYRGVLDPPSGVDRETVADVERAMAEGAVFLALDGSAAIGAARTRPAEDDPTALYCGRLAVVPAAQRRGVGRALMARVEEQAREQGYAAVVLGVRLQLTGNKALFARRGYVPVREMLQPGRAQPTWVMMRKALGAAGRDVP